MNLKKYPSSYRRDAFQSFVTILLSANNLNECYKIADSLFTEDEQLKIGRRLQIFQFVSAGFTAKEVISLLKTSEKTIARVNNLIYKNETGFTICSNKYDDLQSKYKNKKYKTEKKLNPFYKKNTKTSFSKLKLTR